MSLDLRKVNTIHDLKDAAFYQCLQYFLDNYEIASLDNLFKSIFNQIPASRNNIERQCYKMSKVILELTKNKLDKLNENKGPD